MCALTKTQLSASCSFKMKNSDFGRDQRTGQPRATHGLKRILFVQPKSASLWRLPKALPE